MSIDGDHSEEVGHVHLPLILLYVGNSIQFTKILHMTPSEVDEIWFVGSVGGHMCPSEISPPLIVWLPRYSLLNILHFVICDVPLSIQSIITSAFFIVLKNGFHHFKPQRISFHLVYLTT